MRVMNFLTRFFLLSKKTKTTINFEKRVFIVVILSFNKKN